MKDIIKKWVVKNAFDFKGSVNPKFVMGMCLKEDSKLKKEIPTLMKEIEETIKEVKKLSSEELKKQLAPEFLKEKKEEIKGPLKPLPNAEQGKVITRIAPSPSGPLHIGHAYGASLNYEYAKMYHGKFIVRIEDTNPENIYSPAYHLIEEDAKWLTDNDVAQVVIQSSRLGKYYAQAEKLIELDQAYVCTCDSDKWRELKNKGKACNCRNLDVKENQSRYAKMFNEYAEGEAVLRLKTDIKDKNPAMRDFPIMRVNEHLHPKTKKEFRVWPLMVFSVAVDDHELGVTHVLNGKEHADNATKEKIIMEYLGWKTPMYKHWGRINFQGFSVSASKTRIAIEQGEYSGWDDIKLPFLPALRKRGYQPGAFRKYALEIGLSLNDKTVSMEEFWKNVNAFNRELVEAKANRYFFIDDPVEIGIECAPPEKVLLDLHPDFPERGKRKLMVKEKVYISHQDLERLAEGSIHRLMDYCNFEIKEGKWSFVSEDYEDYKNSKKKGAIIHWLPAESELKVEVMLADGSMVKGIGEEGMRNLNSGDIVQLERRYFARLEEKGEKLVFWYLHK